MNVAPYHAVLNKKRLILVLHVVEFLKKGLGLKLKLVTGLCQLPLGGDTFIEHMVANQPLAGVYLVLEGGAVVWVESSILVCLQLVFKAGKTYNGLEKVDRDDLLKRDTRNVRGHRKKLRKAK